VKLRDDVVLLADYPVLPLHHTAAATANPTTKQQQQQQPRGKRSAAAVGKDVHGRPLPARHDVNESEEDIPTVHAPDCLEWGGMSDKMAVLDGIEVRLFLQC